ncbi:MAG TPA: S8 family serine peptidase [Planctomycetota bacterium]
MTEVGKGALPRVVVIDSGIDAAHPWIRGRARVIAGPSFRAAGADEPEGGGRDLLGHGTAIAANIVRFTQTVELVALRVFDREPTCEFAAVLHALRHALQWQPRLVNLSLGTTSLRHRGELEALVRALSAQHCSLVAPASYGGLPCDPGMLDGVEAVVGDANVLPMAPELRPYAGRLLWYASPLPPPDADGVRRLLARGDSLAVAAVTGALLRRLQA